MAKACSVPSFPITSLSNRPFYALCLPSAPYVKVYLLNNGAYVAKKKTKIARKTLDPLYQQALLFEESPQGKVLQVSHLKSQSQMLYSKFTMIDVL